MEGKDHQLFVFQEGSGGTYHRFFLDPTPQ
jgi:hypothetical protein